MAWTRTSRWMVGAGLVAVAALAAGVFLTTQSDTDSGLVQVNGRVESDQIVVSARVPARIADVLVREGDVVARLAGDEFVLVLRYVRDLPELRAALNRMLGALSAPYSVQGKALNKRLTDKYGKR